VGRQKKTASIEAVANGLGKVFLRTIAFVEIFTPEDLFHFSSFVSVFLRLSSPVVYLLKTVSGVLDDVVEICLVFRHSIYLSYR
jgi:hypothetical protein